LVILIRDSEELVRVLEPNRHPVSRCDT